MKIIPSPRSRMLWLAAVLGIVLISVSVGPKLLKNQEIMPKPNETTYQCNGQQMTAAEIAEFRGISADLLPVLKQKRSLSPAAICVMPQAKLDRAISKATTPPASGADDAARWRAMRWMDENGNIPDNALVRAKEQVEAMPVDLTAQAAGINWDTWDELGPGNIGGRVRSIVIKPDNADVMWAGSVTGGIWKTTDGGASWAIADDFMANMSISTLALDPNNYNVLYAGTGESGFSGVGIDGRIYGAGIFKSIDGGDTWNVLTSTQNVDFDEINRLAIADTGTGSTLLAGTGHGVFRSINGGSTWSRSISFDYNDEVLDINFAPGSSTYAVASGWKYYSDYNAWFPAAWYSTNGGVNWTEAYFDELSTLDEHYIQNGGRIEIAYAPSNPNIVYASADYCDASGNCGDIWKSTDGGVNYDWVSSNDYLGSQGNYDNIIWVSPTDANFIIVGGLDLWRSTDSGAHLTQISEWWDSPNSAHADNHYIIEHPDFATNHTAFFGNDGGVYRADDVTGAFPSYYARAENAPTGWQELNNGLGITQFYSAAGSPSTGKIVGGTQDNGTLLYDPATGYEDWTSPYGGDGGFSAYDPADPNYFYGEYVYLNVHRNHTGGEHESDDIYGQYWNGSSSVWKAAPYRIEDAKFETANFIAPFVLDPSDANRMFAGGLSLWRSNNVKQANTSSTGPAWYKIKNPIDPGFPAAGYTASNLQTLINNQTIDPWTYSISSIAVAPSDPNIVWVGYNNGAVSKTSNATAATASSVTWTIQDEGYSIDGNGYYIADSTIKLPDRYVGRITIHPTDPNTVYVTFGGFNSDNIWKTINSGTTWTDISGSLPNLPVYSLVINPANPNWIYIGTELGIFASEDGGTNWNVLTDDGPTYAPVYELFWVNGQLGAATYGRGVWLTETLPCVSLTTGISPSSAGSIEHFPEPNCRNPATPDKYSVGTKVTFTGIPYSVKGSPVFDSFTGTDSGGNTVVMSTDKTVTANFTVTAPLAFGKTAPSNNAVNRPLTLTLKWESSAETDYYEYCIDEVTITDTPNNCDSSWINNGMSTSKELRNLVDGATYEWQVHAGNSFTSANETFANGGTAAFRKFTTSIKYNDTRYSVPANDGWTLESSETSNIANTKNNAGMLRTGDDAKKKQYRSLLYFDTASLPNNAVISSASLQITKPTGSNYPLTLGDLVADMKKGFFGAATLETGDFSKAGDPLSAPLKFTQVGITDVYTVMISPINFKYINLIGATQFRVRFTKDDNNNVIADYLNIYDGTGTPDVNKPQLILEYTLP